MASHLELLTRRVRACIGEHEKLRYKKFTTTSAGAATGATVISTELTELDDHWNGAQCIILGGGAEGQRRLVEDFANSTGTLTFTNNVFPIQIATAISCELVENGAWSGADIKQWLIDSINFFAGVLPKSLLRTYLRRTQISSTSGLATPPDDMLDICQIQINARPTTQIPPERALRMISGEDAYLDPTSSNRFLWYFRGASGTAGEIVHAPAISSSDIDIHYVPRFTDFDSSGNTTFPDEFFESVVYYTAALAFGANEDLDLSAYWEKKSVDAIAARGIKLRSVSKQEGIRP